MMPAASLLGVLQSLALQLAAFLAALLLASGLHKLIGRDRARAAVEQLAGVPPRLAPLTAAAVAGAEILAAALLVIPAHRAAGGVLAALIWGGYLALMLRAIAQGRRDLDCGCSFGAAERPLGAYQAARNAVLTAAALLAGPFAADSTAGAAAPIAASQILAAAALLALYGALDQVMGLMPPRAGESS
jgi:hypothetical protein